MKDIFPFQVSFLSLHVLAENLDNFIYERRTFRMPSLKLHLYA